MVFRALFNARNCPKLKNRVKNRLLKNLFRHTTLFQNPDKTPSKIKRCATATDVMAGS